MKNESRITEITNLRAGDILYKVGHRDSTECRIYSLRDHENLPGRITVSDTKKKRFRMLPIEELEEYTRLMPDGEISVFGAHAETTTGEKYEWISLFARSFIDTDNCIESNLSEDRVPAFGYSDYMYDEGVMSGEISNMVGRLSYLPILPDPMYGDINDIFKTLTNLQKSGKPIVNGRIRSEKLFGLSLYMTDHDMVKLVKELGHTVLVDELLRDMYATENDYPGPVRKQSIESLADVMREFDVDRRLADMFDISECDDDFFDTAVKHPDGYYVNVPNEVFYPFEYGSPVQGSRNDAFMLEFNHDFDLARLRANEELAVKVIRNRTTKKLYVAVIPITANRDMA
jgi:hypothetical protein